MAQDHHVISARLFIFRNQQPAKNWLDLQHFEKIGRYAAALNALCVIGAGESEAGGTDKSAHLRKTFVLFFVIQEAGRREPGLPVPAEPAGICSPHHNDLIWALVR